MFSKLNRMKKMDKKIILASLLLVVNLLVPAKLFAQKPAHVFITAGQSNTDGRVNNAELPGYIKQFATDTVDFKTGAYRYCQISQNRNDGHFESYFPKGRITEGLWTYDAVTYYLLEQALQEEFYVIKYAVGGTSIQYPNDTVKGRFWSANPAWLANTSSFEKGGKSLLKSFTESIDAAIDSTLSKLENGYTIDAFLWHQGESDDRYEEQYYENLKAVVAYVRNHLTAKTGQDYSALPFVFGSIPKSNRHFRQGIEEAQQRKAKEDPNAWLIDMSAQELQKDRTHFNARSAEYLGQKMYAVLDSIQYRNRPDFSVAKYKDDKSCAISYTFDDGTLEHYTLVFPKLKELGFEATFWVNGNTIDKAEKEGLVNKLPRISWAQLKEMADAGQEISNHGWAHKNLTKCTEEEARIEIEKNDSAIETRVGVRPVTYCYAGNRKNEMAIRLASENRVGTRISQQSLGGKASPEKLKAKIESLLQDHSWWVTMTHGINEGYDIFKSDTILWNHLTEVKKLEDQIWVATFRDVAAYSTERDSIKLTTKAQGKKTYIIPSLSLDQRLFCQPLTMVVNKKGIENIRVKQDGKTIAVKIDRDKALFDFDPYGGEIQVKLK